jgi:hypothetical protein
MGGRDTARRWDWVGLPIIATVAPPQEQCGARRPSSLVRHHMGRSQPGQAPSTPQALLRVLDTRSRRESAAEALVGYYLIANS